VLANWAIASSSLLADEKKSEGPTQRDGLDAAEADGTVSGDEDKEWNEYDGKLFTLRLGGGLLVDHAAYSQSETSKQQMYLAPELALRDFRILLKGRFKFAPRLSYSIGYMYDGLNDVWRFRQTGIMVDVKELNGNFFIGRTKEGFSTNKLMVGYYGWTNERAAANDALLPILADGVKWTGVGFGGNFVYNLGAFTNALAGVKQTYVKNDYQFAARTVWLPYAQTENKEVLHLALEGRYGASLDGSLQFRSKPESFPAQTYAVDTGKFPASGSNTIGVEAYYRPGSLMFGSEYFINPVYSKETLNPFFHGGEIFASYLFTGEVHPYNKKGAFFENVVPSRSLFNGGPGAWELVCRFSYVDLESGLIQGGKFWRLTPMVNWYASTNMRLELVYGYGVLDRYDKIGGTQFFQSRLQLSL
jgi:phosphate-selective porin OprO/OprP